MDAKRRVMFGDMLKHNLRAVWCPGKQLRYLRCTRWHRDHHAKRSRNKRSIPREDSVANKTIAIPKISTVPAPGAGVRQNRGGWCCVGRVFVGCNSLPSVDRTTSFSGGIIGPLQAAMADFRNRIQREPAIRFLTDIYITYRADFDDRGMPSSACSLLRPSAVGSW